MSTPESDPEPDSVPIRATTYTDGLAGRDTSTATLEPRTSDDTPPDTKGLTYSRLSFSDIELLVKMAKDGRKQTDIAQVLGCTQSTVSMTLARLKTTPDLVKAIMASKAADTLQSWRKATRKAANRGDHRPAREWLEMAHPELRPPTNNSASNGGGGITIIIGTPTSPLQLPDVTISNLNPPQSHALSPVSSPVPKGLEGETPSKP